MSNQLQQFQFDTTSVRVVTIDNAPWFVAKDVCAVLGLSNPSKATATLEDDEKGLTSIHTLGGKQKLLAVNESGVIGLVMQSRKPEARRFQKWVRSVVIPAIAKDGAYVMGEEKVATGELTLEEMTLRVINALQTKLSNAQANVAALVDVTQYTTIDQFRSNGGVYWINKGDPQRGRTIELSAVSR